PNPASVILASLGYRRGSRTPTRGVRQPRGSPHRSVIARLDPSPCGKRNPEQPKAILRKNGRVHSDYVGLSSELVGCIYPHMTGGGKLSTESPEARPRQHAKGDVS